MQEKTPPFDLFDKLRAGFDRLRRRLRAGLLRTGPGPSLTSGRGRRKRGKMKIVAQWL